MNRPALFVAVTASLAAMLAVAGALIARSQDESVNVWLSLGTALVIGTFLAFLILGPRGKDDEPAAEGFSVVTKEVTQAQMKPRDAPSTPDVPSTPDAPPSSRVPPPASPPAPPGSPPPPTDRADPAKRRPDDRQP